MSTINQNKKWSKDEELIILDCVKESKTITKGLCAAAIKLKRSYGAVRQRYNKIGNTQSLLFWTEKEDKVLIECVKNHATNITEAFRECSTIINRTVISCHERWYRHLIKKEVCFATIGKQTKNINRKNVHINTSDNTITTTQMWWRKFLNLIKLR